MEWELLWKGRCRIYFNASQEAPYIWSIDNGESGFEVKVIDVALIIIGFSTQQRTKDDPAQPKVWLEHNRCAVYKNKNNEVKVTYQ